MVGDSIRWFEAAPTTDAFNELKTNLDYARDLVGGGMRLEQLKVGAFDVADLYRAAWVQVVAALDHWVHRELYDRALGFAANVEIPRPKKYLQIQVPMSLFEGVHHHAGELSEAFEAQLQIQFGYQSFQAPDKVKQALTHVSDVPDFWPRVAKKLSADGVALTSVRVTERLSEINRRRNRIAHEADRDPERPGHRTPVSAEEVNETIDWMERLTAAILTTIGPPPPRLTQADNPSSPSKPTKAKWTRKALDEAAARLADPAVHTVAMRLLHHADQHALIVGGTGAEPSCGAYYWFEGKRRSLWSLYLTSARPSLSLNFWSVRAADETPGSPYARRDPQGAGARRSNAAYR